MKHIIITIIMFLSGCGGTYAKPLNICLQPSDHTVYMANCDSTIQPIAQEPTVAAFVAKQMLNGGNVMIWLGRDRAWIIANFIAILEELKKYPGKVTHIYIVDEMNLCNGHPCIGRDDELVAEATQLAHAAGFKTTAVITQSVIFAPGFTVPNIDVIGIDPYYVTMDFNLNMGGCNLSSNVILNQWKCSVQKLRSLGFTGPVVYVGQGFGLNTDTPAFRTMYLQLQADAYQQSNADGVMSWGCQLSAADTEGGKLVPLCGTQYEFLVTP